MIDPDDALLRKARNNRMLFVVMLAAIAVLGIANLVQVFGG